MSVLSSSTPGLERAAAEADYTIELPGGVPMHFRRIEAGEFRMGSRGRSVDEEPVHRVRITQDFYLGSFPVTQRQFAVWTGTAGIAHQNAFSGRDDHPAESLDWHQAIEFCDWLSQSKRLPEGWTATLPTEAQWEYACRAGTETEYSSGDGEAALGEAGWFSGNSGGSTQPVGSLTPNAWGLYDMHGNVWEWCLDVYDAEAYRKRLDGVEDPVFTKDRKSSAYRVVRGGSWINRAGVCRSAGRYGGRPRYRDGVQGFRVCLLPGPVVQDRAGRGAPASR